MVKINYIYGDILTANTEIIVNPVNCVGVMGAGLALEFKRHYPNYYSDYAVKCRMGRIRLGYVDFYTLPNQRIICSFPTKNHWRDKSNITDIENGLINLSKRIGTMSISFPKLGCGLGGLKWSDVNELIKVHFNRGNVDVYV